MKKFIKTISNLKLTILLIITVLALTIIGIVYSVSGKAVRGWGWKHPFLVSAILGDKDAPKTPKKPVAPKAEEGATPGNALKADTASSDDASKSDAMEQAPVQVDNYAEYPGKSLRPMQYEKIEKFEPRSPYYDSVAEIPMTTEYPYVDAPEDYFKDALFIGDSRIEGLHDYGNINEADFCYKEGVSVFNIRKEKLVWGTEGEGKLSKLLKKNTYKKIYIMIGVNELGKGFATEFSDEYEKLLKLVRKNEPDAVIIVMGIMYVTKDYSDASDVFNNDNINCRNNYISQYIDGYNTFYLDINPALVDDTGALNAEFTNDGIHLTAEYYSLWVDYLKKHALQEDMWK